ncbi:MAG: TolC family protein [Acidiferrobacterales bacterium]
MFVPTITTVMAANQDKIFLLNDQLELKQLIQIVLERNPSLTAMELAWQAAKNRIEQVSSWDDPMLSYSYAPRTRGRDDQDLGQKIQLSQKLPWPGKLGLKEDSARFQAQAKQENIKAVRLRLIEVSVRSFADWYYIHEALRINRVNQDLWQEFRIIAELKYGTGQASKQDALRAEMEQAMLEHAAIILLRKKRNIQANMNTLLNRSPDSLIPPPGNMPEAATIPAVNKLRQMALVNHPELKALLTTGKASEAQVKLAEREYFPDFRINAGYNSLWAQEEKRYTVGLGINIPLALGKRSARVDEKRARNQQLKWQLIEKQAEIAGAVQRAYNGAQESRHVLKLYRKKLLPLAEENLHAAKSDYQSGKGNFLDLVSVEKNLIQTQLNQAQALADYHSRLALLARHVGDPGLLNLDIPATSNMRDETLGETQ